MHGESRSVDVASLREEACVWCVCSRVDRQTDRHTHTEKVPYRVAWCTLTDRLADCLLSVCVF